MRDLPDQFEFECAPFEKGLLYIADMTDVDRYGYVAVTYSPNHCKPLGYHEDTVFRTEKLGDLERMMAEGKYRRFVRPVRQANIEDLI